MASQFEPSAISLSPRSTYVLYGSLSRYRALRAMPTPMERPWPREPWPRRQSGSAAWGGPPGDSRRRGIHQLFFRDLARDGPQRVEQGRGMPLGEDEAVVVREATAGRIVVKKTPEHQRRHEVRGRKGGRGVARARLSGGEQDIIAD